MRKVFHARSSKRDLLLSNDIALLIKTMLVSAKTTRVPRVRRRETLETREEEEEIGWDNGRERE